MKFLTIIVAAILGYAVVHFGAKYHRGGLNFWSPFATSYVSPIPTRNIDATEKLEAKKLVPTKDDAQREIDVFTAHIRSAFEEKRFDALEKAAADLRQSKALFGNGSWKLKQFYDAMNERPGEQEHIWQKDMAIYESWKRSIPGSMTARIGQMGMLVDYAWYARGSDVAGNTSQSAFALMGERLAVASKVFHEASSLPIQDPCYQLVGLRIALGQNWKPMDCETLVAQALAYDPTFYHVLNVRCYALLPRWHGRPGQWEKYAIKAAKKEDGLGDEAYARIIMNLDGYFSSIYVKTLATWPRTRDGLMILRKKYPDSFEILNHTARLATLGNDKKLARECFEEIGERYCESVWRDAEQFAHYRTYAKTGKW